MRILLSLLVVASAACSTVNLHVPLRRPAEIDISRFKQVGVEHFRGPDGDEIATMVQQGLVESGRVDVVDRRRLSSIMSELRLSASDLADPEKAARLGRQLPASALIFGHVRQADYQENMERNVRTVKDNQGRNRRQTDYVRRGTANVRISFQVDDVETGRVVKSKTVERTASQTSRATNNIPPPINSGTMLARLKREAVNEFIQALVPYTIHERARFYKDGKLPELERAILHVRAQNWDRAMEVLNDAIDSAERAGLPAKTLARAYWNRALVAKYSHRFDQARSDVERAFEYSGDQAFLREIQNIDKEAEYARKLAEQEPSSVTAGAGES